MKLKTLLTTFITFTLFSLFLSSCDKKDAILVNRRTVTPEIIKKIEKKERGQEIVRTGKRVEEIEKKERGQEIVRTGKREEEERKQQAARDKKKKRRKERKKVMDERKKVMDERKKVMDERKKVMDEREKVMDEREKAKDEREKVLIKRLKVVKKRWKAVEKLEYGEKRDKAMKKYNKAQEEYDKAEEEWEKAREEYDKAEEEWEKAREEWDKAEEEWEKAREEWDKAEEEWNKALDEHSKEVRESIEEMFHDMFGEKLKRLSDIEKGIQSRATERERKAAERAKRNEARDIERKKTEIAEKELRQAEVELERKKTTRAIEQNKILKKGKDQKDKSELKFIQDPSPKLSDAANKYRQDEALDSLKGLYGEDEALNETIEDDRENTWVELKPHLNTSVYEEFLPLINRCGGIDDYFDTLYPKGKQIAIDQWLEKKRNDERRLRDVMIDAETVRKQIQRQRIFESIKEEVGDINKEICEVAHEACVYKEANRLDEEAESKATERVKRLQRDIENLESKSKAHN